jgi:hypothetical protein
VTDPRGAITISGSDVVGLASSKVGFGCAIPANAETGIPLPPVATADIYVKIHV